MWNLQRLAYLMLNQRLFFFLSHSNLKYNVTLIQNKTYCNTTDALKRFIYINIYYDNKITTHTQKGGRGGEQYEASHDHPSPSSPQSEVAGTSFPLTGVSPLSASTKAGNDHSSLATTAADTLWLTKMVQSCQ